MTRHEEMMLHDLFVIAEKGRLEGLLLRAKKTNKIKVCAVFITRKIIQENPDITYVFGDNMERKGFGGQAKEARGEPNTVGIPTKWEPSTSQDAFFTDNDFPTVRASIMKAFDKIIQLAFSEKEIIFFPNIGKGLSRLNETSPEIYKYISDTIKMLTEEWSGM